jgi:hypothetical protein
MHRNLTYATAAITAILAVKWAGSVKASLVASDKGSLIGVSYITNDLVSVSTALAKIAKSSFDAGRRGRSGHSFSWGSNQRNYWLKKLVLKIN